MKKTLYLSLIIALTALFSSCNKCNKADCQNDASCEKREGICKCTFLYEGEQCENEVRESYVGTYEGSISYPNPDNPFASEESPLTVNVTTRGSSPSDIGINFTFFNTKYELTGQITEEDKFELNELSKIANINKFGFAKKFKTFTGMTPMNYILMRKIFSSKKAISSNSELTEIAYQYNFTDIAHFSKTFKRFIGISPKQYKKSIIVKTK